MTAEKSHLLVKEKEEVVEEEEQEIYDDDPEYTGPGEQKVDKPSKEEYTIAKWLKKNIKTKKTKFLSHNVEYFTSSKAIDALLKSKFAEGSNALFTTREQVIDFLDVMLEHKFFHRAKKVAITLDELRGKTEKTEKSEPKAETKSAGSNKKNKDEKNAGKGGSTATGKEAKKDTDNEKKDTEAEADAGADAESGSGGSNGDKKEKRKRKIRLDMHPEQIFVDGSEAYVWIYDPIPLHYWIFGFILLLGAVGICLFPLWPPMLRQGVYYLSILAAGFLVFILALTVVRLIIFTIVWALTGGKLHFWIFPNLTEDVGFFASFWPLYESKYVNEDESKSDKKLKSKLKKKDKNSDAEEDLPVNDNDDNDNENDAADDAEDTTPLEPEKIEEIKEHDAEIELRRRKVRAGEDDAATESDVKDGESRPSESDSEGSSKDYEFINTSEVQNVN